MNANRTWVSCSKGFFVVVGKDTRIMCEGFNRLKFEQVWRWFSVGSYTCCAVDFSREKTALNLSELAMGELRIVHKPPASNCGLNLMIIVLRHNFLLNFVLNFHLTFVQLSRWISVGLGHGKHHLRHKACVSTTCYIISGNSRRLRFKSGLVEAEQARSCRRWRGGERRFVRTVYGAVPYSREDDRGDDGYGLVGKRRPGRST